VSPICHVHPGDDGREAECESEPLDILLIDIRKGIMPAFAPPPQSSSDKRWKIVNGTVDKHGAARNVLIETLHTVQSSLGFIESDTIRFVTQYLRQRNRWPPGMSRLAAMRRTYLEHLEPGGLVLKQTNPARKVFR
jgi:hypothetical protein